MGFDRPALQLLLNVVMITGVTSLALLWYLRRQDSKKFPVNLSLRRKPAPSLPVLAQTDEAIEEPGSESECASVLNTLSSRDQSIRQYVARRSQEWASAAKIG